MQNIKTFPDLKENLSGCLDYKFMYNKIKLSQYIMQRSFKLCDQYSKYTSMF